MQDKCEYDQMVLLSISDTEITAEEKQKIEAHLKECSSCRKRYHAVSNAIQQNLTHLQGEQDAR